MPQHWKNSSAYRLRRSALAKSSRKKVSVAKRLLHQDIGAHFKIQEARERDPVLRAWWIRKLSQFKAEQLVFLDESGFNWKMGRCKYGRAPKGEIVHGKVKTGKADNLSLLSAMTIDGYIACNVYKGGVLKEEFIKFLEDDLLPRCRASADPEVRSIIVMDNAKIHHGSVCPIFRNFLMV
jgi:DDE superfamily endonuclease